MATSLQGTQSKSSLVSGGQSKSNQSRIDDIARKQKLKEEFFGYSKSPAGEILDKAIETAKKKKSSGGGGGGSRSTPAPTSSGGSNQLTNVEKNQKIKEEFFGLRQTEAGKLLNPENKKTISQSLGTLDVKRPSSIDVANTDYSTTDIQRKSFGSSVKEAGEVFLGRLGFRFGNLEQARDREFDFSEFGRPIKEERILVKGKSYYDPNTSLLGGAVRSIFPFINPVVVSPILKSKGYEEDTKGNFQYRYDQERDVKILSKKAEYETEIQGELNSNALGSTLMSHSSDALFLQMQDRFNRDVETIYQDTPQIENIGGRRDFLGEVVNLAVVSNPFTNVVALGESAKKETLFYQGDILRDVESGSFSFGNIERKPTKETLILGAGQLGYGAGLFFSSQRAFTKGVVEDSVEKALMSQKGKFYVEDEYSQFASLGIGKNPYSTASIKVRGDTFGSQYLAEVSYTDFYSNKQISKSVIGGSVSRGSYQAPLNIGDSSLEVFSDNIKGQISRSREFKFLEVTRKGKDTFYSIDPNIARRDTLQASLIARSSDQSYMSGFSGDVKDLRVNINTFKKNYNIMVDAKPSSRFVMERSDNLLFEKIATPQKSGSDINMFFGSGKKTLSATFKEITAPKAEPLPRLRTTRGQTTLKVGQEFSGIAVLPKVEQRTFTSELRSFGLSKQSTRGLLGLSNVQRDLTKSRFNQLSGVAFNLNSLSGQRDVLGLKEMQKQMQRTKQRQRETESLFNFQSPRINYSPSLRANFRLPLFPAIPSLRLNEFDDGKFLRRLKTPVGRTPSFTAVGLDIRAEKASKYEGALSIRAILTGRKRRRKRK